MTVFPRKGSLRSGASHSSTSHWPKWHYQAQEYSAVLLGVMYPRFAQQRHHGIEHDESGLPPDILINRRSTDLIFYDPIHTSESRNLQPERRSVPAIADTGAQRKARRDEAPKPQGFDRSSSRDLAVLFLRKSV